MKNSQSVSCSAIVGNLKCNSRCWRNCRHIYTDMYPIKKAFSGKKLAPNGSRSGNVLAQMMAYQEVGSPHIVIARFIAHIFLTFKLFTFFADMPLSANLFP